MIPHHKITTRTGAKHIITVAMEVVCANLICDASKSSYYGYEQVNNGSIFVLDAETRAVFEICHKINLQIQKVLH